jgi:hypothetical protein
MGLWGSRLARLKRDFNQDFDETVPENSRSDVVVFPLRRNRRDHGAAVLLKKQMVKYGTR